MKRKLIIIGLASLAHFTLWGCEKAPEGPAAGVDTITQADLHEKIAVLASDEFEGRAPSSPGEEITVNYLRDEFLAYGLQPGNGDSWFQEVPLVDITATPDQQLVISGGEGDDLALVYADEYVAGTRQVIENIEFSNSEMIFVGYGIVAPEYNWNDYEGLDMTGKTAVILVNDPGYATRNDDLFTGFAMTYYGRWTYKYEEAMRQGADAALVIHETGAAGYPWEVVRGGWTGKAFFLESADVPDHDGDHRDHDHDGHGAAAAKIATTPEHPVEHQIGQHLGIPLTVGHGQNNVENLQHDDGDGGPDDEHGADDLRHHDEEEDF